MTPFHKTALFTAIILIFLAGTCGASVVAVDFASKSAKSDVKDLEPGKVQVENGQLAVFIKNLSTDPQSFSLKATGLTEPGYDVYANGASVGAKTCQELEAGISLTVDGRVADPEKMRCLLAARQPIMSTFGRLQKRTDAESRRVCYTLSQAVGWVSTSILSEQGWRSVSVVLSPAGRALYGKVTSNDQRKSKEQTISIPVEACWLLQQARSRMSKVIKDPQLRTDAVTALTPVLFAAVYATDNGKPRVEATLTNNCDLPVTAAITMALPKGWKPANKNLDSIKVKSGQTLKLALDLTAPSKTAEAPANVPIAANLTIVQKQLSASLKLRHVAVKPVAEHQAVLPTVSEP